MSYSSMRSKHRNPYETLERMLNKTTLSTQRVAHSNIVGKLIENGSRRVTLSGHKVNVIITKMVITVIQYRAYLTSLFVLNLLSQFNLFTVISPSHNMLLKELVILQTQVNPIHQCHQEMQNICSCVSLSTCLS